jgi:hypothetical protein
METGGSGGGGSGVRVVYVPARVYSSAAAAAAAAASTATAGSVSGASGSGNGAAAAARLMRLAKWHQMSRGRSPRSVLTTESSSDGEAEYLYIADGDIDVLAEGNSDMTFGTHVLFSCAIVDAQMR